MLLKKNMDIKLNKMKVITLNYQTIYEEMMVKVISTIMKLTISIIV